MRHARLGLILAGLGALGLASWAEGCLFAPDECADLLKCTGAGAGGSVGTGSSSGSGGDAATSGSSGSVSASSSTGMAAFCTVASDCPGTSSVCGEVACQAGKCGIHQLQADGASYSQIYGDCHQAKCLKAKLVDELNDTDVYDDGNPCTQDTCDSGTPLNKVKVGAVCGVNGVCDAKGACVECLDDTPCDVTPKTVCINNHCSAPACKDGLQNGAETDVDCGGSECPPCNDTKYCMGSLDCASGVCQTPPAEAKAKCSVAVPVHALTRRGAADSRMLRWGVSRARGDSDGQRGKMHA
jgi:hypothetical protein